MSDDPDLRLQLFGPDALSDAELISFFLTRGGSPGEDALRTARAVLVRARDLSRLGRLAEGELCEVHGIGPAKARRLIALAAIARRLSERPITRGQRIDQPRLVYESLRSRLGRARREHMLVLALDASGRKLAEAEVARGRSNRVAVTPRDVFEFAVREGADSVILVHNHPSGDPTPSASDLRLTEQMQAAGDVLGLTVLDHVIIADGSFASLAELGQFEPAPPGFRRSEVADARRRGAVRDQLPLPLPSSPATSVARPSQRP